MADTSTKVSSARISQSRAFFKQMALSLPDAKTHLIFWSLMVGGLALDLWTKKAIFDWLKRWHWICGQKRPYSTGLSPKKPSLS